MEFPKLSGKNNPARLSKPRTFWITQEMNERISELQRVRGKSVVINWLRDCWEVALTQAIQDELREIQHHHPQTQTPAKMPSTEPAYEYEY